MEQINEFTVPEELDDERLDTVVASLSEGQSRSYLKNLIKDGSVLLNGKTAKPSTKVRENDKISLVLPEKIIPDILPEYILIKHRLPAAGSFWILNTSPSGLPDGLHGTSTWSPFLACTPIAGGISSGEGR